MGIDLSCKIKEEQKFYKIGVFSQMNRITVKTLRYYDEAGLLSPALVDEATGYRYYTSAQLPRLHNILALREIGFSIIEIKEIIAGHSEERMLQKKKHELLKEIAEYNSRVARIESYLSRDSLHSEYRVIMKSLPEVIIASMKVTLTSYEELNQKMPALGYEMEKAGCICAIPEYCFNIYYDGEYRETDIHVELCEAVTEKLEDRENLKFTVLPEIKMAACTLHRGPYHSLPQAYTAMVSYIEESGYEIIGHQRESYIDGIWNKDTEDEWLTEIQFPVRKIKF